MFQENRYPTPATSDLQAPGAEQAPPGKGQRFQPGADGSPQAVTGPRPPQALPDGHRPLSAPHGAIEGRPELSTSVQAHQHRCRLLPCCEYFLIFNHYLFLYLIKP